MIAVGHPPEVWIIFWAIKNAEHFWALMAIERVYSFILLLWVPINPSALCICILDFANNGVSWPHKELYIKF